MVGKCGEILQGVGCAGKFYKGWESAGNFTTRESTANAKTWMPIQVLESLSSCLWCFFAVILAQIVVRCCVFLTQVREMAAVTFSGLVHYGFFQLDDELQVQD